MPESKAEPRELRCSRYIWDHRAMSDWHKTHSPLGYWADELNVMNYRGRYKTLKLDREELVGFVNMSYGLPTSEAVEVCKRLYGESIAKVVVQIADPIVVQIKKGVRVTFPDQLAVIGGTMGLFTGASLMSIIETLFWMYKVGLIFFEIIPKINLFFSQS